MGDRHDDIGQSWLLKKTLQSRKGKGDEQDAARDGDASEHSGDSSGEGASSTAAAAKPAGTRSRDEDEADARPRVLAYSDSDSDVESHIQRVKEHLMPGNDKEEAAKAAEATTAAAVAAIAAATEAAAAERQSVEAARARRRKKLSRVSAFAGAAAQQVTPGMALRAAALVVLHQFHPAAGDAAGAAACASALAGLAAVRRAGRSGGSLHGPTRVVCVQAMELGKAVALVAVGRLVLRLRQTLVQRRALRLPSGVNVSVLEEAERVTLDRDPETAAEFASVFAPELREMRRMVDECGVTLPQPRFDPANAELMRFAAACGLAQEQSPAERAEAVERAVRRVVNTCEWLAAQTFMPEGRVRKWERFVAWRGADAAGRPILLVRLGRALQLCSTTEKLEAFAAAVAAQVDTGISERVSSRDGTGPEHLVAVIDCRETSNWEALTRSRQILTLVKNLAAALTGHYPGRLYRCYLLELPLLARVALQTVLTSLPADTRANVAMVSADDHALPITVALLQRRRSQARGLVRSSSASSLAPSASSAGSSPRHLASQPSSASEDDSPASVGKRVEAAEARVVPPLPLQPPLPLGNEAEGGAAEEGQALHASSHPAPPSLESPASSSQVAANLLQALDAAGAGEARSGEPASFDAATAPASHVVPLTPGMLSPQSTSDSGDLSMYSSHSTPREEYVGSPLSAVEEEGAPSGGEATPSGGVDAHSSSQGGTQGEGLRAHHLVGVDLSRDSLSSVSTPGEPRQMRGGLTGLPPRPTSDLKTPGKSSLRRTQSQEAARPPPVPGTLGSFPLRRQSSVSWAEVLER